MKTALKLTFPLLLSFLFICLGHGLLITLISIRAALDGFSSIQLGLIGFFYFGGFIVGIQLCSKLLNDVGHIRTFAALASMLSAICALLILFVDPYVWMLLRFCYGMCMAALFMVIESWLNHSVVNEFRGRMLSLYTILIYLSFALSQFFLNFGSPGGYRLFVWVSILISVAVVPFSVSKAAMPIQVELDTLPFKQLIALSPTASFSCISSGLLLGVFLTMTGAFLIDKSYAYQSIAWFISAAYFGCLVFQWPLGRLSDIYNRLIVLKLVSISGLVVFILIAIAIRTSLPMGYLILLFLLAGGCIFPMYSLSMARVIDNIDRCYLIKASGSLLMMNATASMMGALISSLLMTLIDSSFYLYFCMIVFLTNSILGFYPKIAKGEQQLNQVPFAMIPRTTAVIQHLAEKEQTHCS